MLEKAKYHSFKFIYSFYHSHMIIRLKKLRGRSHLRDIACSIRKDKRFLAIENLFQR